MGKIVVHMAAAGSVLSVFTMPLLLCLPLHTLTFFSGGVAIVAKMKIFTGMANNDITDGDFCSIARAAVPGDLDFCETIRGHQNLQDLAQRFCVAAMDKIFRGMCEGLSAAYALGLAIIIFQCIGAVLHIIALWSLYNYVYNSPKKVYRDMAFALVLVGTILNAICLGIYAPMVSMYLDNVTIGVFGVHYAIDVSKGTGVSIGYWLLWVAVMVQCMQLSLYKASKSAEERLVVETKMQREFEAELAFGVTGRDFHVDARGWFNAELATGGTGELGWDKDKTVGTNPYAQNNKGLQPLPSYRGAITPAPTWGATNQSWPNDGAAPAQSSAWPAPVSVQCAPPESSTHQRLDQSGGGWPPSRLMSGNNFSDPGSQGPSRQASAHLSDSGGQDGWPPSRQVSSNSQFNQGGWPPAQPGSGYLMPPSPQGYLVPPSFDVVPGSNGGGWPLDSGMPSPPPASGGGAY